MTEYFRPLIQYEPTLPHGAVRLADGWCWFERVEVIRRDGPCEICAARDVPGPILDRLAAPRHAIAGLSMDAPRLMGILNVTPDSFSDGGQFDALETASRQAMKLVADGADILDIGGESTRPGAREVPVAEEIGRVMPVLGAVCGRVPVPISIDTRKSAVAQRALAAGVSIVNDVSGLSFDRQMAETVAENDVAVCLMHAQGTPETMQSDPSYDNVLLDIYDWLEARIEAAVAAGIARSNIIVDPGIGFGKTMRQNLALLRGVALFHGLGCPLMLGTSRKRFVGTLSGEDEAARRMPGSVGTALAGVAKGVQITRIHDVRETRQALALWQAATGAGQGR